MEEGLPKIPKLDLVQMKFSLTKQCKNSKEVTENLMKEIEENSNIDD